MSKILLYKTANKFNESLVDHNYKVTSRFFKINALGLGIYLELIFFYLDFHKTVKFIRWLAAGGTYGRLTPAQEGAALLSPYKLDCFVEIQTEKL